MQPAEPPTKWSGGAVKRRKRTLSYKAKKGSNNQKRMSRPHQPDVSVTILSDLSPQQDNTAFASGSTNFKYTKKEEIIQLLYGCQKELAEAQTSIRQKDDMIQQLTKKNNLLLKSSYAARGATREAKMHVKKLKDCA
jgi:Mg2+ and Co2+ transporter CorA